MQFCWNIEYSLHWDLHFVARHSMVQPLLQLQSRPLFSDHHLQNRYGYMMMAKRHETTSLTLLGWVWVNP